MIFAFLFTFLVVQRFVELFIARRNERIQKEKGAQEYAPEHYKYIVLLHTAFLISLLLESSLKGYSLSPLFGILFVLFVVLQALRIWTIRSLGHFWNTKIIILPGSDVVKRGPFRFMRHPNYVIVALELIVIPLLFNAFFTAILFTILNAWLIRFVRIPAEEGALKELCNYEATFKSTPRFIPNEPERS